MSKLLVPDIRSIIDAIHRRLDILERRVDPKAIQPSSSRHSHDGTGTDSTVVYPKAGAGDGASGYHAITVGWFATAEGDESICIGNGYAYSDQSIAIGQGAEAAEEDAAALGHNASSSYFHATALGPDSQTEADNQVVLGTNDDTVVHPGQVILTSAPGGIQYYLVVSDAGVLSTVAV